MSALGQIDIALAATEESLYIVPSGQTATLRVIVTNRTGTVALMRVAHVPGGGTASTEHYLTFDRTVPPNDERASLVFDMAAGDEVRVESSILGVTFQANGVEL